MIFTLRTTVIAAAVIFALAFVFTSSAYAQSSYLDQFDGKTIKELRGELESRIKSNTKSKSEKPKIKINRASIRKMMDRYLPRD